MKIKSQLFIMGLLLSILPLALVSTTLVILYNTELNRVAENNLRSLTTAQINVIDNFFLNRNTDLSILSDYGVLLSLLERSNRGETLSDSADAEVVGQLLRAQTNRREFLYSITAADLNLNIVACTEPIIPGQRAKLDTIQSLEYHGDAVWFSRILQDGEFGRRRCLVATRAVYNDKHQHIGYLVEEIALNFIDEMQISTTPLDDGSIYITDGEGGLILAGADRETRYEFKLESDRRGNFPEVWAARDLSQPIGIIRYQIDGRTYLSSYGHCANVNWHILSTICLDSILHVRESFFRVLLVLIAVTLILVFAVDLLMHRTLSLPIGRMIQTFSDIRTHKDFSKRISDIPSNEIGVIAHQVNTLLADIEHTVRYQEERLHCLKERAERDPLTGLFNQRAIEEVVSLKIKNASIHKQLLAFVLVDIDDFKSYNTQYGHVSGDAVICFVTRLMNETSGDSAGRIGGDEFVMCIDFLPQLSDVERCMDEFVARLREGVDTAGDGCKIPIPCSIGVMLLSGQTSPSYEEVLRRTDAAMYDIKNSEKDGYKILT